MTKSSVPESKRAEPNRPEPAADEAVAPAAAERRPEGKFAQRGIRRVVNVPLLIGTLITCAVLGPSLYFWHRHQVGTTTDMLLARAAALEAEEDWTAAADFLQRYLQLAPDDLANRIRLMEAFDKSADDPRRRQRLVGIYYQTLGMAAAEGSGVDDQELAAMRGRLLELLVQTDRFAEAEREGVALLQDQDGPLVRLLNADPENAATLATLGLAQRSLALARHGLFLSGARVALGAEPNAVGRAFLEALPLNTGESAFVFRLAQICRDEPRIALWVDVEKDDSDDEQQDADADTSQDEPVALADLEKAAQDAPADDADRGSRLQLLDDRARVALADRIIDQLVAQRPEDSEALFTRFVYRTQYGLADADEDLDQALAHDPGDVAVFLTAGDRAWRRAARESDPERSQAFREEALAHFQRAREVAPDDVRPYVALGQMHRQTDRPEDAIGVWREGLEQIGAMNIELNLQLADLLIERQQYDEARDCLRVVQEQLVRVGSRLDPGVRVTWQRRLDLLLGSWHASRGEYGRAIPLLQRVATLAGEATAEDQQHRFSALYMLAQCRAQLDQWEQAAGLFEQAIELQPNVPTLHALAANAWSQAGRWDRAARRQEQLVRREDTAEHWLGLAQARLREQSRVLPRGNRVWDGFLAALDAAKDPQRTASLRAPWQVGLLEVEYLLLRGDQGPGQPPLAERVRGVLTDLETRYPDAPEMWTSLALIYQRLGDNAAADRAHERLAKLQPDGESRVLVQAQLLAARGDFEAADRVIEQRLDAASRAEAISLRLTRAALWVRGGKREQAIAELAQVHELQPENLAILQQWAELSFEQGDLQAVQTCEKKLREIEGEDGALWRYQRARRLLLQARTSKDAGFLEAAQLANELLASRPGWPPAVLLSAMLYHRTQQIPQAIDAYEEAIRAGERRIPVYERLISLLYQAGRLTEAEGYLNQLQEYVPMTDTLSGLKMLTSAGLGHFDTAIQEARRRIERRPEDAAAHRWLGQLLAASGDQEAAEKALRQAISLAPDSIENVSVLLTLYLSGNRQDAVRSLLDEIRANDGLPGAHKQFVMAQAYQQLGERELAQTCYEQAYVQAKSARERPEATRQDTTLLVSIISRWVLTLSADEPERAEELLREALPLDPSRAVRRILAAVLAASGTEEKWAEAQSLLAADGSEAGSATLDKRLHAALLVRRGSAENLDTARQLLEELLDDPQTATTSDRLLLARLFEAQARRLESDARQQAIAGDAAAVRSYRDEADAQYAAARRQYLEVATADDAAAEHLAALVEFLVRQKEYDQAEEWFRRLVEIAPDNLGVAGLQARLLQLLGRGAELEQSLEPVAQKQLARLREQPADSPEAASRAVAQLALSVGTIYQTAQRHAAAEPWLRKAWEHVPAAYGPLAGCLAAQGRVAEAIELCLQAAPADESPRLPLTLASLVVLGTATPEDLKTVDPLLSQAVESHPESADLLTAVASVRVLEERIEEAIPLLETALRLSPDNLVVLNNLATILAEQPDRREEALEHISRAIELSSPSPALLDSKGSILFHLGRWDEARACLEAATWDPRSDPRYFFHLAAVYLRQGDREQAATAFRHALDNNLEQKILTPSDRVLLEELREAFAGEL